MKDRVVLLLSDRILNEIICSIIKIKQNLHIDIVLNQENLFILLGHEKQEDFVVFQNCFSFKKMSWHVKLEILVVDNKFTIGRLHEGYKGTIL